MPLFKKLLNKGTEEIVNSIGNAIDKLSTTTEEKLQAKNELSNIVINGLSGALRSRSEVILSETKGNTLQRSWRPITALSFAFIVVSTYFILPVLNLFLQNDDITVLVSSMKDNDNFWLLLRLMIVGYVGSRGVEKVAEIVTKNVDISFIRKRRRKKHTEKNT